MIWYGGLRFLILSILANTINNGVQAPQVVACVPLSAAAIEKILESKFKLKIGVKLSRVMVIREVINHAVSFMLIA